MTENQQHLPVTELLVRWRSGDREALEELVPLVYKELREIARYHLQRERPGHTLQSAALVNEAYLDSSSNALLIPMAADIFSLSPRD